LTPKIKVDSEIKISITENTNVLVDMLRFVQPTKEDLNPPHQCKNQNHHTCVKTKMVGFVQK